MTEEDGETPKIASDEGGCEDGEALRPLALV